MIITITGKLCSGKGTVAKELCSRFNFEYIGTGNMFREYAKQRGYDNILTFQEQDEQIKEIDKLIVRGGWPENINSNIEDIGIIPKSYIDSIVNKDINERKDKKRDPNKMRMLIRSLSRNESSVVGNDTIVKDIEEYENNEDLLESKLRFSSVDSVILSLAAIRF